MSFFKFLHPNLRRGYEQATDYSSANYAVLSAINDILQHTEDDSIKAKIQSHLDTATGQFLDSWGSWFGTPRKYGQSDEDYRDWIITYVTLQRGTKRAIINAIKMYLNMSNATIDIYEPYKHVFTLDKSYLDGLDHLPGDYYRWAIIDIYVDRPVPKAIETIIRDFKPAGVNFYITIDTSMNKENKAIPMGSIVPTFDNLDSGYFGFDQNLNYYVDVSGADYVADKNSLFILDKSKLDGDDVLGGGYYDNLNLVSILQNYGKEFIYGTSYISTSDVIGGQPWNYQTTSNNYDSRFWSAATIAETKQHDTLLDMSGYTQANYASHLAYVSYTGVLKHKQGDNTRTYESLLSSPQEAVETRDGSNNYYEYTIGDTTSILGYAPDKFYLLFSATTLDNTSDVQVDLLDKDHILLNTQHLTLNETTNIVKLNYSNEEVTQPDSPFVISQSAIGEGGISAVEDVVTNAKYIRIYEGTKGDSTTHEVSFGQPCLTDYDETFWVPYENDSNSTPLVQDELFNVLKPDNTTDLISLNSNGQPGTFTVDVNVIGWLEKNHQDFWGGDHISTNKDILNYLTKNNIELDLHVGLDTTKVTAETQLNDGSWVTFGNKAQNSNWYFENNVCHFNAGSIKNTGIFTFRITLNGVDSANLSTIYLTTSLDNSRTLFAPTTNDSQSYLKFFGAGVNYDFYTDLAFNNNNKFKTKFAGQNKEQLYIALNARKQLETRYNYLYKEFHNPKSEPDTLKDILNDSGLQLVGNLSDNYSGDTDYFDSINGTSGWVNGDGSINPGNTNDNYLTPIINIPDGAKNITINYTDWQVDSSPYNNTLGFYDKSGKIIITYGNDSARTVNSFMNKIGTNEWQAIIPVPENAKTTRFSTFNTKGKDVVITFDVPDNHYSINLYNFKTSQFDEIGQTQSQNVNGFNFNLPNIDNYLSDSGFLFIKIVNNSDFDNIDLTINNLYLTGRKAIDTYEVSVQTNASLEITYE